MAYLHDTLVEALGGSKLIGAQGMEYGGWSPNNYRSVVITLDGILVEGHLGGIKLTKLDAKKAFEDLNDSRSRNMLNAFELKKFMGLEEVIIDGRLNPDTRRFMSTAVDERGRLRAVVVSPFNEMMFKVITSRIQDTRQKAPEALISEMFGLQAVGGAPGPSRRDWYAKVNLTAKVYSVDRMGGKLYEHLKGIAESHGVQLVEEVIEERTYTDAQTDNINAHRENVAADLASDPMGDLESIKQAFSVLKKYRDAEDSDKIGIRLLASTLAENTKAEVASPVPGLDFYLKEFGEADNIPEDVVDLYFKRGFAGTSDVPSHAKVDITGGYLQIDRAVKKSVVKVMKSRLERKLYSPEPDLFVACGENLHEFVNLLIGGEFDYSRYSKTLQALASKKTGTELSIYLASRREEGGEIAEAVEVLEGTIYEEEKNSPLGFLKDLQKGIAKLTLRIYDDIDNEKVSEYGARMLTKSVKVGSVALAVKFPMIRKAIPALHVGVDYTEQHLIEYVENLLSAVSGNLREFVKDEEVNKEEPTDFVGAEEESTSEPSSALTLEREQELYNLFNHKIYWSYGIDMMAHMFADSKDFSTLKYRQIKRLAKPNMVVEGLSEFLEKYSDKVGPNAVGLFREAGYLGEVEQGGKDRLFDPEAFFSKLVDEFSNLSKRRVRNKALAQLEYTGGIGWDNMKIYNATARELMGLRGRIYGFPEGA